MMAVTQIRYPGTAGRRYYEQKRRAGRASSCWRWPGTTRGGSGCRVTAHPAASRVAQAARNLIMDRLRAPDAGRGS